MELTIADYTAGTEFTALSTCRSFHVPNCAIQTKFKLQWFYSEPTTVFGIAGHGEEFVTSREVMLEAIRSGSKVGFPLVGEGNVKYQVMPWNNCIIAILFNEFYTVLVDRDALTDWITGTLKHAPLDREESILDIEGSLKQAGLIKSF